MVNKGSSFDEVMLKVAAIDPTFKKKILIADDDDAMRGIMRSEFENVGFKVFEASNGEEAIQIFDTSFPHIVLLDFMMPKVNGIGVFQHIRTKNMEVPVVFVTAYTDCELLKETISKGWAVIVGKPMDIGQLTQIALRLTSNGVQ